MNTLQLEELPEITSMLMDGAGQPELLSQALTHATRWLDCDFFHLVGWAPSDHQMVFSFETPALRAGVLDYQRYFGRIDPRRALSERAPVGKMLVCHDYFDDRFASRSEFFQDFLVKLDARYAMGGTVHRGPGWDAHIVFNRTADHGRFTAEQRHAASLLMPLLQGTLQLLMRTQELQATQQAHEAALQAWGKGLLLLSEHAELLYANDEARAWMGRGGLFEMAGSRVHGAGPVRQALAHALSQVLKQEAPISFSARVQRAGGSGSQLVSVTVLRPQLLRLGMAAGSRIALLLDPLHEPTALNASDLQQRFALTPAQARVAAALSRGHAAAEIARDAGTSLPTVRSQIWQLLERTESESLQALLRLLANLPRV